MYYGGIYYNQIEKNHHLRLGLLGVLTRSLNRDRNSAGGRNQVNNRIAVEGYLIRLVSWHSLGQLQTYGMVVSNQQQQRQHFLLLVLPVLACAAVVGYQVGVMAWRRKRKKIEAEGGSSAYVLVFSGLRLHQSLSRLNSACREESDKVYS